MNCPDERTMLELVAGRLPAEATDVRAHLDSCESCRTAVAALAEPPSIGRYQVQGPLGRGAMGIVYRARDPELERDVAVKLVPFRDERLLREARALAKLAHPNVVRIYDVGTAGESVFLAMELVAGMDLARWLTAAPRSPREVAAVMAAAADGLAAAHRAGMIHRDFKPSNVLVGDDGRVLVGDFGLVQAAGEGELPRHARGIDDVALTRTGAIVGTPAYLAPELVAGGTADERSDQFSFAVALFEGLYGVRPFAGDDLETLWENVLAGRVRTPPRRVPARLHAIAMRGLGPREARFGSLEEVAAALREHPRRRAAIGVGAACLVAAGALAIARPWGASSDSCAASERPIAATWSPARAVEVALAFGKTGTPYAADAWRATAAQLDHFAGGWRAGARAACEATRAGVQSGELLDRRVQCLEARRAELADLVDALAHADRGAVARAVQSAGSLSRVEDCANTLALGTLVPPPAGADPAAIARLRARIAHVHVLRQSKRGHEAIAETEQVLAEAKRLAYAPTTAEAELASAIVYLVSNKLDDAKRALADAIVAAEAGRDFHAKAQALAVSMELAFNAGDLAGAADQERLARAALAAIGGDPKLEADLESVLGWIASYQHDHAAAQQHLRRALALRTQALGEQDLMTGVAHENLGTAIADGDPAAALAEFERGLAIERAQLGEHHPAIAQTLGNVAVLQGQLGHHAEAIATAQQALAILEASMGPTHPTTALATLQVAAVYHQAKDDAHALPFARSAVARYEAALGPNHPDLARARANLADIEAAVYGASDPRTVRDRALSAQAKEMLRHP